ncbi:glutathione S-transferase family protein [Ramlibacter sp.]|uniref:glutathione S-transferase family protein n=1 Tax=Ramlibacter sp. TaxID=1917967 RepID=UPI002FC66200
MTLKLYFAPGACSFVPHALLEATGTPFEPRLVKLHRNEQDSPEYRALNPHGQVPVLVDGDAVITQILAIVGYLDARFPEQQFLPQEPLARAKAMETLAWMNNTVHPTFTHVFMPHKFSDQPDTQAQLKAFNAKQYRPMLAEIEGMAQRAAAQGQAFLGGERFGPIDAYALTLLRWGGFAGIDPAGFPALWAHVQKVAALAPVARAMERERLQLNVYKAA